MTAGIAARRSARRAGHAPSRSRFGTTPGALIVVCGVHGGSGATTVAAALAGAASTCARRGGVLAVEADGVAGELAERLGTASSHGLAHVAALAAAGDRPDTLFADRPDGLRVLATDGPDLRPAAPDAIIAVLREARRSHALVVCDGGSVAGRAASWCLPAADVVVWTVRAERLATAIGRLASPLARPARGARWVLAVQGARVPRRALRELNDDLHARVTVSTSLGDRPAAAGPLVALIAGLVT